MTRQKWTILSLLVVTLIMGAGNSSKKIRPARWTLPRQWRKNVADGVSSSAVYKALGEPKYIRVGEPDNNITEIIWYYQEQPYSKDFTTTDAKRYVSSKLTFWKKKAVYNDSGSVRFKNGVVVHWIEPDWGELEGQIILEKRKEKPLKPAKKTSKWQIKKNWNTLKFGFHTSAVEKLLGQPEYIKRYSSKRIDWYYGEIAGHGILRFDDNGKLVKACHPFWVDVEKEVKEQVEFENKEKLKKELEK